MGSPSLFCLVCGGLLVSHTLSSAVPSPLGSLASGFGMGPGVSCLLCSPQNSIHLSHACGLVLNRIVTVRVTTVTTVALPALTCWVGLGCFVFLCVLVTRVLLVFGVGRLVPVSS